MTALCVSMPLLNGSTFVGPYKYVKHIVLYKKMRQKEEEEEEVEEDEAEGGGGGEYKPPPPPPPGVPRGERRPGNEVRLREV